VKHLYIAIVTLLMCLGAWAQTGTNSYTLVNLVTNTNDPNLINPWGLSRPVNPQAKENEWWTSNQGTGTSGLYDADGTVVKLVVTIPSASGVGHGTPTGTVFNANNFVFATQDGTISNWFANTAPGTPGQNCAKCHVTSATIVVNNSAKHAVYNGLAVAKNGTAMNYYAANSAGGVEAYTTAFKPVTLPAGAFTDPKIPASYTPFGIQTVSSRIYVTFYNATLGGGFVDAFNSSGKLLLRLQHGQFSEPWGIAQAPSNFGYFSKMVLVGNTASGWIGAYNPSNGQFAGFLNDSSGQPITIPGLWGILFGNGNVESGPANTLYFNGGGNYFTGAFGAITAN
jgi:uncharacterized protein (TIGR03118 family)